MLRWPRASWIRNPSLPPYVPDSQRSSCGLTCRLLPVDVFRRESKVAGGWTGEGTLIKKLFWLCATLITPICLPTHPTTPKSICRADVGKWLAHLRASHLWTSPPPVYSSILCFWPFHYLHGSLPATPLSPRRDRYETKCGDMCCRGPLWHWPQRESVISSFYFFSFTLISFNVGDTARICNTHACLCVCVCEFSNFRIVNAFWCAFIKLRWVLTPCSLYVHKTKKQTL